MKKNLLALIDEHPYLNQLKLLLAQQGPYLAGHYYSPLNSQQEVDKYLKRNYHKKQVHDIDLRKEEQLRLLDSFSKYYKDLPFTEEKSKHNRYYYNQEWFRYSDAIMLYCFIRHFNPKRIIEIGSGFSSAVMLDTLEKCPNQNEQFICIEPHPERLHSILRKDDYKKVEIIDKNIQDIDLKLFKNLQENDLLFIDSSHVVKFGSDLHIILFEILPRLPKNIFVHFHDIFYLFEYPKDWLEYGRSWNESYFIRALLAWNPSWKTVLFNSYINVVSKEYMEKNFPLCRKGFGASIYLTKTGKS